MPDQRAVPPCGRIPFPWKIRSSLAGLMKARVERQLSRAAGLLPEIVCTSNLKFDQFVLECCSFWPEALCCSTLAGYSSGAGYQSIDDDLAIAPVAGIALGAGQLRLTGRAPNGQRFIANPLSTWTVPSAKATIDGRNLGAVFLTTSVVNRNVGSSNLPRGAKSLFFKNLKFPREFGL